MAKRLKVGVIGLGTVAQIIHLPILKNLSDLYEIAALCDISRQLLEDIGKRYSIDRLYTTPHELVAQQDIDVVFVLNSDEYHAECAIEAAQRHKHVFIEKPMCLTLREADEIIAARDSSGVQVMVGYMRRFAPAFLQGVEEIKRLGTINYARVRDIIGPNESFIRQSAHVARYDDLPGALQKDRLERSKALVKEAIGDVSPETGRLYRFLGGLSSHDLSAMREMLGFPRQVVSAVQGASQFLTVIFAYDGYYATFETGVDLQGRFDAHIEVFGATRSVRVQYDSPFIRHLPTQLFISETRDEVYHETTMRPTFKDPYTYELEYLYEAITQRLQPKTSPEDFKKDLLLFQMIIDASKLSMVGDGIAPATANPE